MGSSANGLNGDKGDDRHSPVPGLWITGIGSQFPPYLGSPETLDTFAKRFYDVESPGCVSCIHLPRWKALQKSTIANKKLSLPMTD